MSMTKYKARVSYVKLESAVLSVVPEGALEEMGPRIDQKLTRADREAPKRSNFFSIGLTKQKTIRNKTSLSAKKRI